MVPTSARLALHVALFSTMTIMAAAFTQMGVPLTLRTVRPAMCEHKSARPCASGSTGAMRQATISSATRLSMSSDSDERLSWVELRREDPRDSRGGGTPGRGGFRDRRGRGGGRYGDGDDGRSAQRERGQNMREWEPREPRNDRRQPWTRGDDGVREVDEVAVEEMLGRRERAKRNRDYEVADAIRDDLLAELGVHVDDQRRVWWPDGAKLVVAPVDRAFGLSPPTQQSPWTMGGDDKVSMDDSQVLRLLDARDAARRARDFALADDLMLQLRELGVAYADDRARQWFPHVPGSSGRRSGDWDCPACGAMVYGTKNQCFSCGEPRPAAGATSYNQEPWEAPRQNQEPWEAPRQTGVRVGGHVYSERFPPFSRAKDDDGSEVDEEQVELLLAERESARRFRDYRKADDIRDRLRYDFGVSVDDLEREWRTGAGSDDRFGGRPGSERPFGGEARGFRGGERRPFARDGPRDGSRRGRGGGGWGGGGRDRGGRSRQGEGQDWSRRDLGWD
jgi:hypothetical protein